MNITTQTERAAEYARQHPQEVRLCWLDRRAAMCPALEAVALCSIPHVAAMIVGTVADDKALETMLNLLINAD